MMDGGRDLLRVAAAFFLAPVIASALAGLVVVGVFVDPTEEPYSADTLPELFKLALAITAVGATIAVPTTLTLGLAAHTMFQRRGVTSAWAYILTGALAGALVPAFLTLFFSGMSLLALYGIPVGAATAFLAWLIRRPDRDAPNPPTSAS